MNVMACYNCNKDFEIGYFNAEIKVYLHEAYHRNIEVTCPHCSQEYKFFMDKDTDNNFTHAGVRRTIADYPPENVKKAFIRTYYPCLSEEDEETVAQFAQDIGAMR